MPTVSLDTYTVSGYCRVQHPAAIPWQGKRKTSWLAAAAPNSGIYAAHHAAASMPLELGDIPAESTLLLSTTGPLLLPLRPPLWGGLPLPPGMLLLPPLPASTSVCHASARAKASALAGCA